jgi:DMSO/TMAO reductase YedYZ heme-binding membrane subunit
VLAWRGWRGNVMPIPKERITVITCLSTVQLLCLACALGTSGR